MFRLLPLVCFCLITMPVLAQEQGKKMIMERNHATVSSNSYSKYFRENSTGQVKREYVHDGKDGPVVRNYQVYIPENYSKNKNYPLIVLLHDRKRTGVSMVQQWMQLADSAGLVLLGPTHPSGQWVMSMEEANIIEGMVDHLDEKVNIDRSRIYLFGHSDGGHFASFMPLLKPELFAAIGVHAGALLQPKAYFHVENLTRKVPIIYLVGMEDSIVPIKKSKASAKFFADQGHDVMYVEYVGHNHWYYTISNELNLKALTFMSQFRYRKQ